jgi:hypothetical protein
MASHHSGATILALVTGFDMTTLLDEGQAWADLSSWRKILVSGAGASAWLQDLVSADLAGLEPGRARRSLLLSPTGRIRADFTAARTSNGWLLLQDPTQPRAIDELLAPYVLSADVRLEDRSDDVAVFAFPGWPAAVDPGFTEKFFRPSSLGPRGVDVIASTNDRQGVAAELEARFPRAGSEAVEDWRVRHGIPRFGVDAAEDDLPQEGGLDDAVAFDKGCYLGQEAVAKVRNLGHPRRLVLHLEAGGTVSPGDEVLVDGRSAGVISSAAAAPGTGGTVLLARVRWESREGPFHTATGVVLAPRQASSPV